MSKKITPTTAELKSLIFIFFKIDDSKKEVLKARFLQELGGKAEEYNPATTAHGDELFDLIADILAGRLKRNRRTVPLFSSRDQWRFSIFLLKLLAKEKKAKLDAQEIEVAMMYIDEEFKVTVDLVSSMIPPDCNPYEGYWRWINTVIGLATKEGIAPAKLLKLEWADDEISRQLFSEVEFLAFHNHKFHKFMDEDAIKQICFQPLFELATNEEERYAIEQHVEASMPQIRSIAEKSKVFFNTYLNEEVARIYKSS